MCLKKVKIGGPRVQTADFIKCIGYNGEGMRCRTVGLLTGNCPKSTEHIHIT